jgi:hypothetical protein
MYKIDINNKLGQATIEDLLENDLIKLLEKLRYTKQDTITNEKCKLIMDTYFEFEPLCETLGYLFKIN